MDSIKITFSLSRTDACALWCLAEQDGVSVPYLLRRMVQAEVARREASLKEMEHAAECLGSCASQEKE